MHLFFRRAILYSAGAVVTCGILVGMHVLGIVGYVWMRVFEVVEHIWRSGWKPWEADQPRPVVASAVDVIAYGALYSVVFAIALMVSSGFKRPRTLLLLSFEAKFTDIIHLIVSPFV